MIFGLKKWTQKRKFEIKFVGKLFIFYLLGDGEAGAYHTPATPVRELYFSPFASCFVSNTI